ncbi:MAG: hypothetical protein JJ879_11095 [Sneathiella sp.]|nr:hypothetical protein [Sneathiella sp.]
MSVSDKMEILLVTVPGLEELLRAEAVENGFKKPEVTYGGVTIRGYWSDVWRANLTLRGASRVLVRLGAFRVTHLAKLDQFAHEFPWEQTFNAGAHIRVEASCKKSKIYHKKAAAERFEKALVDRIGAVIDSEAELFLKIRIVKDICTISIDSSGEGLHKRGIKQALNRAPLRETLAALMLRQSGFRGKEPVIDPMCGSGTLVLEAAEIATRQLAGRARSFAFQHLNTFDPDEFQAMKERHNIGETDQHFYGFDRDRGAISRAEENAERGSVSDVTTFAERTISDLRPPSDMAGLLITNPPYGTRIGDQKKLTPLYQKLGHVAMERFKGWRVGILTNSDKLAAATGLPFKKDPLGFSHGGIRVHYYQTDPLE